MRHTICKLGILILVTAAATVIGLMPKSALAVDQELAAQASIVFRGTVQQIGNTTLAALPPSADASVVTVDKVMRKPHAVVLDAGDRITVLSDVTATFQTGEQAVFFTRGELFGNSLAVRVLGVDKTANMVATSGDVSNGSNMAERISTAQVEQALQGAAAVFVGEVKEIRLPTAPALRAAPRRVTEHDPEWREAVVQVTSAIKGVKADQQIVVRFSASRDVAWYRAPKLTVGQMSTFLLKPDTTTGAPMASLAGQQVHAYQALAEGSVLSPDAAGEVRSMLHQ